MEAPLADRSLEQPLSLDVSAGGRMAVLDRGGRRLHIGRGDDSVALELDFQAARCRFLGESVVLLGEEGLLRTLRAHGETIGEIRLRPGAINIAVMRSGSVLVSYGRRGAQEHGITLERLGDAPLLHRDPTLLDATGLAVESGAFWIAGTGSASPAARAIRLRPVASGLKVCGIVALPAPPRAAAIGPDNALYVVLEPGESVARVRAGEVQPALRLPAPVAELARGGSHLWGCGPRGLVRLSQLVPRPSGSPTELPLPPCSP